MRRVLLLVLVMMCCAMPAYAMTSDTYEQRVVRYINGVRWWDVKPGSCADRHAEAWARRIKRTGRFVHRDMGVIIRRCDAMKAGEVMAKGSMRPSRVIQLWLDSPTHRGVILDGAYNRIGVGAVRYRGGWIVVADLLRR